MMEGAFAVRVFDTREPGQAYRGGAVFKVRGDGVEIYPESPEVFSDEFKRFVDEEIDDLSTKPVPQKVYGDVATVLTDLQFRVVEDEMEHVWEVDVLKGQAIRTGSYDDETGLVAERTHGDTQIGRAFQTSADVLSHRFPWLDVISPRSFGDLVDAAEDLVE